MKEITIKAEYLVKSDLANMLLRLLQELKDGQTEYLEIESNIGGKLTARIVEHILKDLRR